MKKSSVWTNLVVILFVIGFGIWALATMHLQTELLPLFPGNLASVQGVRQSMSVVSSAQQVTVVATPPAATAEIADRLERELGRVPEVQAISIVGQPRMEPLVKMAAWMIVNLPPEKFAEFQALWSEREIDVRLRDTLDQLAGALDPREMFLLRMDPLQMLSWLQAQPHQSLPLTDFSTAERPSVVVMQVRARHPLRTFDECEKFIERLRHAVDTAVGPASPDVRQAISITGQPAFVAENSGQMRSDMSVMVLLAVGLTSLLIFVFYRSASALIWMTLVLALALLAGVIAARVLFGELNVVSAGFSSILIGLGSDYCILVYHFRTSGEADLDGRQWRTVRRGIWLSALTTSLAFGALYFSHFPGLQQLVVLIGAGLLTTALFATTLLSDILQRVRPTAPVWLTAFSDRFAAFEEHHRRKIRFGALASLVIAACLWPIARHYKFYDPDFNRLRPAHSEAARGIDALMEATKSHRTFDVMVSARSWDELRAKASRVSDDATLLPQPDFLAANRARWKPGKQPVLRAALEKAGFEESWGAAPLQLLDAMDAWAVGTEDFESARLFLSNVVELPGGEKLALVRLPVTGTLREMWAEVKQREPSSLPASWQLMIEDMQRGVLKDARRLSLWMFAAVAVVCWWARRSWAQVALNGLALALTFVGLLALLWMARESMTLHSLLAVPVMVAVAIEYSLYMLLGLESNAGDLRRTFRQLAVPVFLMGMTTIIGFGAPVATHQPTLKNFGMVMAMGTFAAMITGLVVVPAFYSAARGRPHYSRTLYRAFWFDGGTFVGKHFGRKATRVLGRLIAGLYELTHPKMRAVVRKNLSLLGSRPVNDELVHKTIINYGTTLADYFLLGTRPKPEALALATERIGLEHLQQSLKEGKGLILATAHLGLFEYGALWMEEIKQPTVILTLPEPSHALSEWRAAYRKRWGAETIEVGTGAFGSVEIVRHLKQDKAVAMLMDRPFGGNFVPVEFPGGRVPFSTGPVWLSLLSGAPIVAVTIVRLSSGGYRIEAHPPVYPQWLPAGRDETVEHFTKELGLIFRKVICEHPDQWYQFAPLSS